jgi:hypothetical protein
MVDLSGATTYSKLAADENYALVQYRDAVFLQAGDGVSLDMFGVVR